MKKHGFWIWVLVLLMVFSLSAIAFAQGKGHGPDREVADLVLHNATIYTMDENNPVANSIAIKDGKIIAVGHRNVTARVTGPGTEIINLKKATVLPGLIDAHVHFSSIGTRLLQVDAYWLPKDVIIQNIADAVEETAPGEWIQGRGFNQEIWDPPVWPTKEDLDVVSPDNPVYIGRYCGHAAWVNSKALEVAGIDKDTEDPPDGSFLRDQDGNPTGILLASGAMNMVRQHIPPWTEEQILEGMILANEDCLSVGLTGVHDAGAGKSTIDLIKKLYEEGELQLRIYQMVRGPVGDVDYYLDKGPQIGLYDNHYTIRSIKMSLDGALGARTAAMLEPYSDWPDPDWLGVLRIDLDIYNDVIQRTLEAGFQSRCHNIGDRANRLTLDAFENALDVVDIEDPRLVIEHAQILHPDDIPRFVELDVIASMQPLHATEDMIMAEDRVGPERILTSYAWRTLLDKGVTIAGGSDSPVSPHNPFYGIHAAVTRQNRDNKPEGGWYPEQVVTREEALRMFTLDAAYAAFEEDIKGSLEPGKLADLAVINQDIMDPGKVAAEDIWKTEVLKTMIGGEFVYEKE